MAGVKVACRSSYPRKRPRKYSGPASWTRAPTSRRFTLSVTPSGSY